ncbi:hypothetical protein B0T26DRAFT_876229 [Lasiosphaeria miniovina]|uniref:Uncharacterized protein n=1 Tax=Lasiosphaeria miniovina TaxID=1954250 RepID=A0AA39ZT01_9PEZI|nr:uncharacterized protein B0T26DRAFT_876229 [Lasiosphaeria miniovina]KAK0703082.1 hypothetical protein B0T26DRAFT_876229 [Lasiosphaeria miniovina]
MGAPVILCGRTERIGEGVIALLKPEFEVIHFILSPEAGAVEIPAIFRGEQPPPPSGTALGSKDYSQPPVAVILGGCYDDADIELLMKARWRRRSFTGLI